MAEGNTSVIQKIVIYQNISVTFSNSDAALINVSNIDTNLGNAKVIFVTNSSNALPFIGNLTSDKTKLQLTSLSSQNGTFLTNIMAIY